MKLAFWICFSLVAYTYVLYPIIIAFRARVRRSRSKRPGAGDGSRLPFVSVILCARDEANRMPARLDNLVRQDYDPAKLELIVVSDGSTDGTADAVRDFQARIAGSHAPEVVLIEKSEPEGKPAGLNDAVRASRGELLVMTDARQLFGTADRDNQTIRNLVRALEEDPAIGCVSGELVFVDEHTGTLQADLGAYWRYEKWIRRNESDVDSVPGVTGAVYAIRRHLYEPIPRGTLLDDVVIPLRAILKGCRVTFDGRAVARDQASSQPGQEWRRKVRTLSGNWQLMHLVPGAFNPLRNRIWWQFISHKILRLLVPFALIAALATSAMIAEPLFRAAFALQALFYTAALLAAVVPALRRFRIVALSHTFVLLNLAAIAGFLSWATGRSGQTWRRPSANRA